MLDSLEHLERISVSVFQKITDKVNEQRNTLQKVQQRAAVAKKAVEWVQNERKNEATRVLSSPHYPDKDISNVEYSPTFSARDRIGIQQMEFHKFNPGPNNILFNHKLYNPIEHFEKSPTRQNKQSQNKHPKKPDEGVGKLPFKNVQSVSELLCFNTNMNVYHKYHGADPLQANYHTTMMMMAMEGTSSKNDKNHDFASANNLYIDPAPPSLSKDSIYDMYWGSSASQEQNIKAFAPTRRELPMFEFPSNLGLPNIVDTAQWDLSLDNMPSIAPSSLPSLDLGNNSTPNTNTIPSSSTDPISSTPSVPTNVPPPPVTSAGVVPPPPVAMGSVPPPPVVSSGNVPPPPITTGVPQPPSIPIIATPSAEGTGDDTEENESGGGDRSDLLASIRSFSKNKLKKANRIREKGSSKEVSAPQKSSGPDMMTDLFRIIGLRRNAIEGSKDEQKPKKKKKEKKAEEPIPPVPTSNPTQNNGPTAPDSSAVTELPKMPPPPKRPQQDEDSDGSDVDSW